MVDEVLVGRDDNHVAGMCAHLVHVGYDVALHAQFQRGSVEVAH